MNRWVAPLVVVASAVAGLGGAGAVAPQPVPAVTADLPAARSSVVCPSFRSDTTSVRVAATALDGPLFTSRISRPDLDDEATGVRVLTGVAEPVRVSAAGQYGATTVAEAPIGLDRGLSAVGCLPARSQWWFGGVDTTGQADLVLANVDGSAAAVDITVWTDDGRVSAPGSRGIMVAGHDSRQVSLGSLVTAEQPVSVLVETSQGRVSAMLRQRRLNTPTSGEWVPPVAEPATSLVIPGIPDGPGRRDLAVTNPGDRTASVGIAVLGVGGSNAIAGVERIDLPPRTTRVVEVTAGLAEQAAALRLTSEQPVTAAVLADSAAEAERSDRVTLPATPAATAGVWPVSVGKTADTVLHLANPGADEATVTVTVSDALGAPGTTTEVVVAANSSVQVDVTAADTSVVRLADLRGVLHAGLVVRKNLDGLRGLGGVALTPIMAAEGLREVVFDPLTGS